MGPMQYYSFFSTAIIGENKQINEDLWQRRYIEIDCQETIRMMCIMALWHSSRFSLIFRPFLRVTDRDTIPF